MSTIAETRNKVSDYSSAAAFTWRWREFLLLLFPISLMGIGFYVLQILSDQLLVERYWPAIVLAIAGLGVHFALSKYAPDADETLLPLTLMMSGMGMVMIERLASNFTVRQMVATLVGLIFCCLIAAWNNGPRFAERYRYTLIFPGIFFLVLGLVVSYTAAGPGRSVIGIGSFGIQPSEPLKILLILFLAGFLDFHREKFATVRLTRPFQDKRWLWVFIPLLGMWGISMLLLVLQRDMGMALLFFAIFLILAYLATQRRDYVLASLGFFLAGGAGAYQVLSYIQNRFTAWIDPWSDPDGLGFQLVEGLLAIAHGGLFGQGLGQGFPDFVPVVHSDFIIVAIGEEWGLAGILAVVGLFILFMARGLLIAMRARDSFLQLVAGAITATLCLQAFIILGGSLKLIPLTGVTLPFIAYGGSSMVTTYMMLGILLRISRERGAE